MNSLGFYKTGLASGSGPLGSFTHDESILKKMCNEHGINMVLAAVAEDSGAYPDGTNPAELAIGMVQEFFDSSLFTKMKPFKEPPDLEKEITGLFKRINELVYIRGKQEGLLVKLSVSMVIMIEEFLFGAHVGTGSIYKVLDKDILLLNPVSYTHLTLPTIYSV
mgnify:CR=1 FL=1